MISVTINSFVPDVLANRGEFDNFLQFNIAKYIKNFDEISKICISFPSSLTKSDRYNIHLMTKPGNFQAISRDSDTGRILDLYLSKKYVQDLFEYYDFPEPVTELILLPIILSEKQILFNQLLEFIEKNLADEFKNFLNTI